MHVYLYDEVWVSVIAAGNVIEQVASDDSVTLKVVLAAFLFLGLSPVIPTVYFGVFEFEAKNTVPPPVVVFIFVSKFNEVV